MPVKHGGYRGVSKEEYGLMVREVYNWISAEPMFVREIARRLDIPIELASNIVKKLCEEYPYIQYVSLPPFHIDSTGITASPLFEDEEDVWQNYKIVFNITTLLSPRELERYRSGRMTERQLTRAIQRYLQYKINDILYVSRAGYYYAEKAEEILAKVCRRLFGRSNVIATPFSSPLLDIAIPKRKYAIEMSIRAENPITAKYVNSKVRKLPDGWYLTIIAPSFTKDAVMAVRTMKEFVNIERFPQGFPIFQRLYGINDKRVARLCREYGRSVRVYKIREFEKSLERIVRRCAGRFGIYV